jgi:hypothetical protein
MLEIHPVNKLSIRGIPVGFSIAMVKTDSGGRLALASRDGSEIYCLLPEKFTYAGGQTLVKARARIVPGARDLKISFTDAAGDEVVIAAQERAT